jgi:hypothetical protein
VFYHIYAGKTDGVYYSVYLKNPPQGSYYSYAERIQVASGFIPKGEYADEAKDFTSPEGYKELCVSINGVDRCGFKEVSTSLAVEMLANNYAKGQIDARDIKSESECTSGAPSAGALIANINPQASVEEAVLPDIYQRGIVRLCASVNPGASTEPSRYVEVGTCGGNLKCWLDSKSIKDAITSSGVGAKNESLQNVQSTLEKQLETTYKVGDDASIDITNLENGVNTADKNAEKKISAIDKVNLMAAIDAEYVKLYFNSDKARLLLVRADLLKKILNAIAGQAPPVAENAPAPAATSIDKKSASFTLVEASGTYRKIMDGNRYTNLYILNKNSQVYADVDWIVDPLVGNVKTGGTSGSTYSYINIAYNYGTNYLESPLITESDYNGIKGAHIDGSVLYPASKYS